MSQQFSQVVLDGRLTSVPKISLRKNGALKVADLSVAVNRDDEVMFIDVAVFGDKNTSILENAEKGQEVLLVGFLRQSVWRDEESGNRRSKLSVIATHVAIIPKQNNSEEKQSV